MDATVSVQNVPEVFCHAPLASISVLSSPSFGTGTVAVLRQLEQLDTVMMSQAPPTYSYA